MDFEALREFMVQTQLIPRGIHDKRVLNAMRKVPRHLFVDEPMQFKAYDDMALSIGENQTISQPYMVAIMTELLELKGDEKVLEIGTGSGYQAAILAELAEEVYSIERIPPLAKRARKVLDSLKYTNIIIRIGDGTNGLKEFSPYDGIITTAAAPEAPDPLLLQLDIGGRLIIPIGDEYTQDLKMYVKEAEDTYREQSLGGCRFVKLIGEHGWK